MEDMRRVVVMERKQPTIPSKWNNSKVCFTLVVCQVVGRVGEGGGLIAQ